MQKMSDWVNAAPDRKMRVLREAIHTVLIAIANSAELQPQMIMKGDILLAIRYDTGRFTKDIDFSARSEFKDFDEKTFVDTFEFSLIQTSARLSYQLECRLQKYEVQPNRNSSYPAMKINVGYAAKLDRNALDCLQRKQSPNVIQLDYSFNELVHDIDIIEVDKNVSVQAYGETTLIAEKLRSILQQVVRNRSRRQDIFDLHYLFKNYPINDENKPLILESLIQKCRSRGIEPAWKSMASKEIYDRSAQEYLTLESDTEDDLPDFDLAFGVVRQFYESMPWQN